MLHRLVAMRGPIAMGLAAAVGAWGLHAHPVDVTDPFLGLIEARSPRVFMALVYGYAALWFTTPLLAASLVLSLFAILFAYDAVSGEKERGTLRLSFANNLPRGIFILGKIFGSFLALAVPLLVPILLGCMLLPLLGAPMTSDDWFKLGCIILAGLLYFGVFLTLSVFMSALT